MFMTCVFIALWSIASVTLWMGFVLLLAFIEVAMQLPDETLCTLSVASWFLIPSVMGSAWFAWATTLGD